MRKLLIVTICIILLTVIYMFSFSNNVQANSQTIEDGTSNYGPERITLFSMAPEN